MQTPNSPDDTSWWDELVNAVKPQQVPPPPPPPQPPVDQSAWEKSVEQAKVQDETVHDVGLRIFQETKSYSDRSDSNEPLDIARQKIAHSIINADQTYGFSRMSNAKTALPIEPSANALNDPATRTAYESSMKAAREAYLSGTGPTNGAVHFNARGDAGRRNWLPKGMNPPGKPLKTQSGPYNNSYTEGDTPYSAAWLNTYEP